MPGGSFIASATRTTLPQRWPPRSGEPQWLRPAPFDRARRSSAFGLQKADCFAALGGLISLLFLALGLAIRARLLALGGDLLCIARQDRSGGR